LKPTATIIATTKSSPTTTTTRERAIITKANVSKIFFYGALKLLCTDGWGREREGESERKTINDRKNG
jgi:hypothetical protein